MLDWATYKPMFSVSGADHVDCELLKFRAFKDSSYEGSYSSDNDNKIYMSSSNQLFDDSGLVTLAYDIVIEQSWSFELKDVYVKAYSLLGGINVVHNHYQVEVCGHESTLILLPNTNQTFWFEQAFGFQEIIDVSTLFSSTSVNCPVYTYWVEMDSAEGIVTPDDVTVTAGLKLKIDTSNYKV